MFSDTYLTVFQVIQASAKCPLSEEAFSDISIQKNYSTILQFRKFLHYPYTFFLTFSPQIFMYLLYVSTVDYNVCEIMVFVVVHWYISYTNYRSFISII